MTAPSPKQVNGLLWLLAIAGGLTVANLYYSQPLLVMIGATFGAGAHETGLIPTATQLGYAAGMLFVVPLGDTAERRALIATMTALATLAVLAVALAPSLPFLLAASFALGLASCAPQLVVPFATGLVPADSRGRAIGRVMGGLLVGILLSRTASGLVAAHLGWRAIYWLAFAVMLALAVLLRALLPAQPPAQRLPYRELLASLPGLLRREPLLRRHALMGALAFASFSAFWTTLTFLLRTPPHHYGPDVAGGFGVIGVAGALAAPAVGRLADRHGSRFVNGVALAAMLVGWLVFALFWKSLVGLAVGVVLLDLGVQSNHISNQSRVLGLSHTFRNRLNTVYMVAYFIGGAAGALFGASSFAAFGWAGTSLLGLGCSIAALLAFYTVEREASVLADAA